MQGLGLGVKGMGPYTKRLTHTTLAVGEWISQLSWGLGFRV